MTFLGGWWSCPGGVPVQGKTSTTTQDQVTPYLWPFGVTPPPPPQCDRMTDACENITLVHFVTRAVNIPKTSQATDLSCSINSTPATHIHDMHDVSIIFHLVKRSCILFLLFIKFSNTETSWLISVNLDWRILLRIIHCGELGVLKQMYAQGDEIRFVKSVHLPEDTNNRRLYQDIYLSFWCKIQAQWIIAMVTWNYWTTYLHFFIDLNF